MTKAILFYQKEHAWIDLIIPVDSMRAACKLSDKFEFNYDEEFKDDTTALNLCDELDGLDEYLIKYDDLSFTDILIKYFDDKNVTGFLGKVSVATPTKVKKYQEDIVPTYKDWDSYTSTWIYLPLYKQKLINDAINAFKETVLDKILGEDQ